MSSALAALLPSATTYGLAVARCSGFVVASPFPGSYVPVTQRVGLVVVLALVVTTTLRGPLVPFDGHVVIAAATELLLGVLMGLVFRFTLVAADMVGAVFSQATGLGMPSVLNPATETQDATPSRIVDLAAILVALGMGAHRVVLADVLASFRAIPPGTSVNLAAGVLPLLHVATDALGVGLRLAMPLVGVALVAQVALALVARTAPSIQIFSAGFTVLIASGLLTFIANEGSLVRGLSAHLAGIGRSLETVVGAVVQGQP